MAANTVCLFLVVSFGITLQLCGTTAGQNVSMSLSPSPTVNLSNGNNETERNKKENTTGSLNNGGNVYTRSVIMAPNTSSPVPTTMLVKETAISESLATPALQLSSAIFTSIGPGTEGEAANNKTATSTSTSALEAKATPTPATTTTTTTTTTNAAEAKLTTTTAAVVNATRTTRTVTITATAATATAAAAVNATRTRTITAAVVNATKPTKKTTTAAAVNTTAAAATTTPAGTAKTKTTTIKAVVTMTTAAAAAKSAEITKTISSLLPSSSSLAATTTTTATMPSVSPKKEINSNATSSAGIGFTTTSLYLETTHSESKRYTSLMKSATTHGPTKAVVTTTTATTSAKITTELLSPSPSSSSAAAAVATETITTTTTTTTTTAAMVSSLSKVKEISSKATSSARSGFATTSLYLETTLSESKPYTTLLKTGLPTSTTHGPTATSYQYSSISIKALPTARRTTSSSIYSAPTGLHSSAAPTGNHTEVLGHHKEKGTKPGAIAAAVLVPLIVIALGIVGCVKYLRYKKQKDLYRHSLLHQMDNL